ncbi:hypothetical protein A1F94_009704 [Pyrenophora tritici-repentis]|nr:hypothetical protein A1F94_009704 [Pyrenophora tritici-repentis]
MAGSQSNSGDTDADVQSNYSTIHPNAIQASAQKLYPQERSLLLNTLCDTVHTQSRLTISTHLWGVPAPEDADETHATTWVAKAIHDYHVGMEWDERLYFDYQWDFEGWTRELFQKVERTTLRSLKTVLRYRESIQANFGLE